MKTLLSLFESSLIVLAWTFFFVVVCYLAYIVIKLFKSFAKMNQQEKEIFNNNLKK